MSWPVPRVESDPVAGGECRRDWATGAGHPGEAGGAMEAVLGEEEYGLAVGGEVGLNGLPAGLRQEQP